jgi:hypothetical protein
LNRFELSNAGEDLLINFEHGLNLGLEQFTTFIVHVSGPLLGMDQVQEMREALASDLKELALVGGNCAGKVPLVDAPLFLEVAVHNLFKANHHVFVESADLLTHLSIFALQELHVFGFK